MSILRALSLGPIVGHTTDTSCKLWIRSQDANTFQVGVLKLMEINGKPPGNGMTTLYYFRLGRECNRIGIFNLGQEKGLGKGQAKKQLDPNTKYKVCLATLPINNFSVKNKKLSNQALKLKLPKAKALSVAFNNLGEESVAVFRTFPKSKSNSAAKRLTFLLGSCRYPGSDRIFVPMAQQVRNAFGKNRPRFVLMVGDQIYADKFSRHLPIERAETYEEFQDRYLEAFGSHNMRRLLRHTPTYMILDDHEIEDNWSSERLLDPEKKNLFCKAIRAYKNYQWSHGPRTFGGDRIFYYTFDVAGYPFFVLDTRTKRAKKKKDITKNEMLGKLQRDCLLAWLKNMQEERGNVPKFIVSSNVFVPNEKEERTKLHNAKYWLSQSDSWPAFPTTRAKILDCIVKNKVQNVVFLSGDIHCSNVAKIKLTDSKGKPLKAFSITSSPFFTPFFDGDPEDYVSDSQASEEADSFSFGNGWTMNYRSFFPFSTRNSSFCRVEIDKNQGKIVIHFFDDDGDPIVWTDAKNTWNFPKSRYFKMEPW